MTDELANDIDIELAAAARDFADAVEKARLAGAKVAALARRHSLDTNSSRAAMIVRDGIGQIRRGQGDTEYGRRVDIHFAEALTLNPGHLMRLRDQRRQANRFGASQQAKDHAVNALMDQVHHLRAARP